MKIAIYSRPETSHRQADLEALFGALERNGDACILNREFASKVEAMTGCVFAGTYADGDAVDADLMLSYGGDGTFLDIVSKFVIGDTPLLGVNLGRLGFLANVSRDRFDHALGLVADGRYAIEERVLLRIESPSLPQGPLCAFNDFSIQKRGANLIAVNMDVDGEMVCSYGGDGVLVSTPAGSTAYSLSVGGPVVSPGSRCFVVSPIAAHNLTIRPLVVPDSAVITLEPKVGGQQVQVTADSRSFVVPGDSVWTVRKDGRTVKMMKLEGTSFYKTLKEKLMWGFDRRNG